MTQVTVTETPRVARIQGDLSIGRPATVQAFFVTDGIDENGAIRFAGGAFDCQVLRTIDEAESAKTVTIGDKTYTRGEILNAVAAMAFAWRAEDDAKRAELQAAAEAAAAAAAQGEPPAGE